MIILSQQLSIFLITCTLGLIEEAESLFTYPTDLSTDDFIFSNHVPIFVDEIQASPEVLAACGDNERCIFDASQTGNLDIGLDTMQTDETNMDDQLNAGVYLNLHHRHLNIFNE